MVRPKERLPPNADAFFRSTIQYDLIMLRRWFAVYEYSCLYALKRRIVPYLTVVLSNVYLHSPISYRRNHGHRSLFHHPPESLADGGFLGDLMDRLPCVALQEERTGQSGFVFTVLDLTKMPFSASDIILALGLC